MKKHTVTSKHSMKGKKKTSRKVHTSKQASRQTKATKQTRVSRSGIERLLGGVNVVKTSSKQSAQSVHQKHTVPKELKLDTAHPKQCVLMDTNFVMLPASFKIDIFEQAKDALNTRSVEFMVFDMTIFELQHIAAGNSKHASHARVALDLINHHAVTIIPGDARYADDLIAAFDEFLPERNVVIATQDKGLKLRLRKKSKLLVMRGKSRLEVI